MKKSYQTLSYCGYPVPEVVRRLARWGYDAIELSAASECGGCYPDYLTAQRLTLIRDVCRDSNLDLVSYDCELGSTGGWNVASPNEEVRGRTEAYVRSSLLTAGALGAKVLVVSAGRLPYGVDVGAGWEWATTILARCAQLAHDEGVLLGVEHLPATEGNVVTSLADYRRLFADVSCPALVAVLDTGHVNVNGESLPDYVLTLGDRLGHVHLDDNDGLTDGHLVPGEGRMEFRPLFAALKETAYAGAVSVEVSLSYSAHPDAAACRGIEFLRRHLG